MEKGRIGGEEMKNNKRVSFPTSWGSVSFKPRQVKKGKESADAEHTHKGYCPIADTPQHTQCDRCNRKRVEHQYCDLCILEMQKEMQANIPLQSAVLTLLADEGFIEKLSETHRNILHKSGWGVAIPSDYLNATKQALRKAGGVEEK
jgi:hypothetical protein